MSAMWYEPHCISAILVDAAAFVKPLQRGAILRYTLNTDTASGMYIELV